MHPASKIAEKWTVEECVFIKHNIIYALLEIKLHSPRDNFDDFDGWDSNKKIALQIKHPPILHIFKLLTAEILNENRLARTVAPGFSHPYSAQASFYLWKEALDTFFTRVNSSSAVKGLNVGQN